MESEARKKNSPPSNSLTVLRCQQTSMPPRNGQNAPPSQLFTTRPIVVHAGLSAESLQRVIVRAFLREVASPVPSLLHKWWNVIATRMAVKGVPLEARGTLSATLVLSLILATHIIFLLVLQANNRASTSSTLRTAGATTRVWTRQIGTMMCIPQPMSILSIPWRMLNRI